MRVYVRPYVRACARMGGCVHAWVDVCVLKRVGVRSYVRACDCDVMCIRVYIYIYIYIYNCDLC